MTTSLSPYLSFRDDARQAMTFYQSVFGGELDITTFGAFAVGQDPDEGELVMHAQLSMPDGMNLMGADTPRSMPHTPGGAVSVSLWGDDETTVRGWFDQLAASGMVTVPMEKAPWGDVFGMCTDGFGVAWLVNVSG